MKIRSTIYLCSCVVLAPLMLSCQPNKKVYNNESIHEIDSSNETTVDGKIIADSEGIATFSNDEFNLQFSYPGSFNSEGEISAVGLNGEVKNTEIRLIDSVSDEQIKIKYYPANQSLKIYNQLKSREGYAKLNTGPTKNTLEKNETILMDGKGHPLKNPINVRSLYFLSNDSSRLYEIQFRTQADNQKYIDKSIKSIDFLK